MRYTRIGPTFVSVTKDDFCSFCLFRLFRSVPFWVLVFPTFPKIAPPPLPSTNILLKWWNPSKIKPSLEATYVDPGNSSQLFCFLRLGEEEPFANVTSLQSMLTQWVQPQSCRGCYFPAVGLKFNVPSAYILQATCGARKPNTNHIPLEFKFMVYNIFHTPSGYWNFDVCLKCIVITYIGDKRR